MSHFTPADRVHRLIKEALDRGTVRSIEEAEALFQRYRLVLEIAPADALVAVHQATLLTAIALARRVFLGGVIVRPVLDAPLLVPQPLPPTLVAAIEALGARTSTERVDAATPHIVIGGGPRQRAMTFELRTIARGWRGGIVPVESPESSSLSAMPLAGMLAAALAVNEAFIYARAENAAAGHRELGLSLWNPQRSADWTSAGEDEPTLELLPSRLWILGLGHLGQAYLWALGLLPYADAGSLELVLQDTDIITPSTESTSILTDMSLVGLRKTRAMAAWAERRGFNTTIQERRFDAGFRRQHDEPSVLLCGLDNAHGRRALDEAGFELVVEAGLGRGHEDFRTLRLHTLPATRKAMQIWPLTADAARTTTSPAYQDLLQRGIVDRCGMTLLAGKAVGAPFVGATAASLVVAQVLRVLHGAAPLQLLDLDLQWPEHLDVVPQQRDFSRFNPGFVRAA